jgi:hypothetical protein
MNLRIIFIEVISFENVLFHISLGLKNLYTYMHALLLYGFTVWKMYTDRGNHIFQMAAVISHSLWIV